MAIRFCKGEINKLNLENALLFDKNIFINAHNIFLSTDLEYIPLIDKENNYICCCYDDHNIDNLYKTINIIYNSKYGKKELKRKYLNVSIISLNEISYYLYKNFLNLGCNVKVVGDLWKYLDISLEVNKEVNYINIYSEGNPGLSINELGYWKTTFPFNEYDKLIEIFQNGLKKDLLYDKKIKKTNECNLILTRKITSNTPFMAARLGNTESIIVNEYYNYYTKFWLKYLYSSSGFYSQKQYSSSVEKMFNKTDVDFYSKLTVKAIKNCDINLCNFKNEIPLINRFSSDAAVNVAWYDLYTNFDSNSWINALKGKKVLIVSSFNETIKKQYKNKKKLFRNFVLPDLKLMYYDFPTTYLGNYNLNISFFDNYKKIFNDIKKIDFDVAIIAAGAYGYLLASDIKNINKQAIELCSGLYPIFGIKNKTQCIIRKVSSMYNSNWIFPIEQKPTNYMSLEKGAYWD